jgi:hypothetical protein
MVTQRELGTYRGIDKGRFPVQRGLSSATAWLGFYALAILGGIVAKTGKAIEVVTGALH